MSCYSVAAEIPPGRGDCLVELGGFEPMAFKCWLSEGSVASELESFYAIGPVSGGSSYLEAYFVAGRCLL
jgi:hypothetical protein